MQVSVKQVEASAVFAQLQHGSIGKSDSGQACQVRLKNGRSPTCAIPTANVQPQNEGRERFVCNSGVGYRSQTRVPVLRQSGRVGRALLVRNAVDDAD